MSPRTRKKPAWDTVPIVATCSSSRLSGKEQGIAGIKPNEDKREEIADVAVNEGLSVVNKQGGEIVRQSMIRVLASKIMIT